MKSSIVFILLILFIESLAHNNPQNKTNNSSKYKTFLVKTKLTKELIQQYINLFRYCAPADTGRLGLVQQ